MHFVSVLLRKTSVMSIEKTFFFWYILHRKLPFSGHFMSMEELALCINLSSPPSSPSSSLSSIFTMHRVISSFCFSSFFNVNTTIIKQIVYAQNIYTFHDHHRYAVTVCIFSTLWLRVFRHVSFSLSLSLINKYDKCLVCFEHSALTWYCIRIKCRSFNLFLSFRSWTVLQLLLFMPVFSDSSVIIGTCYYGKKPQNVANRQLILNHNTHFWLCSLMCIQCKIDNFGKWIEKKSHKCKQKENVKPKKNSFFYCLDAKMDKTSTFLTKQCKHT